MNISLEVFVFMTGVDVRINLIKSWTGRGTCEGTRYFSKPMNWLVITDIYSNTLFFNIYKNTFYLSNRPLFLWVYWRTKPNGMLGEHEKAWKARAVRRVIYKV